MGLSAVHFGGDDDASHWEQTAMMNIEIDGDRYV